MNESTPTKIQKDVVDLFLNLTPIFSNNDNCNNKNAEDDLPSSKRKINVKKNLKSKKQKSEESEKLIDNEEPLAIDDDYLDLFVSDEEIFKEVNENGEHLACSKHFITPVNSQLGEINKSVLCNVDTSDSEDIFLPPLKAGDISRFDNDSMFDKLQIDSLIANSDIHDIREESKKVHEETFSGISRIFNEFSFCGSNNDADVTALIKNKLLDNAKNAAVLSPTSSGWTQFQEEFSEPFALETSKNHNWGPFHGLSLKVEDLIKKHKGINDLYDWQKECLNLPAIQERKNLVYALPTSGGKTLVAEILMLREILFYQKNVLFVLPFVSIVQEKVRSLSPFAIDLGFLVEEYAAGKGSIPPRKRRRKKTILVCTIEKALVLVQSLIETGRLHELGLVVIDELHLVAEGSGRGAALESLITFLMHSHENVHIIGMSATIGNLNEISGFLQAETYTGDFRPVELTEFVKCGENVYRVDWTAEDPLIPLRTISSPLPALDPDGIAQLVQEVCPTESALIFCPTKKNCENVASLLCKQLPREFLDYRSEEKKSLLETLTSEFSGRVCSVLRECIRYGVAYHHSGLTGDERKVIEEGYREGVICCICCTSTLAAGVNLPAKRVILRAPYVGREFITLSKYKQMVGRAGRAGLGSCGESFLICQVKDVAKVGELLKSKMDDSVSALTIENCKELVLSAVGLGVAVTRESLRKFLRRTLLHVQADRLNVNLKKITDSCIIGLCKSRAICVQGGKGVTKTEKTVECDVSKLDVTVGRPQGGKPKNMLRITNNAVLSVNRIGRAAIKGGMNFSIAIKLYEDLIKAERSLVLLCSLHILYLVTPYQTPGDLTPNFSIYFDVYMQLSEKEQLAAKTIGFTDNHVAKMAMGQRPKNLPEELVNRFYVTLVVNELWKQQSVWEVAALFQIPRGLVQNLMSSAASFSWNVLRFCEELEELWSVKALLAEFTPRLAHCCETELLPLMDLPAIKRARARQLYQAGFKTLQLIARAQPKDLVSAVTHLSNKAATQIISASKLLLMEKVENLKEEVDEVLGDLGQSRDKLVPS